MKITFHSFFCLICNEVLKGGKKPANTSLPPLVHFMRQQEAFSFLFPSALQHGKTFNLRKYVKHYTTAPRGIL